MKFSALAITSLVAVAQAKLDKFNIIGKPPPGSSRCCVVPQQLQPVQLSAILRAHNSPNTPTEACNPCEQNCVAECWPALSETECQFNAVFCPANNGGGAMDDPHFKTWAGKWYDFMGACDLTLLFAPLFAGDATALDIKIRTKIQYDYSFIEAAVVKIGEDSLEVASFGDYLVNGISNADLPAQIGGFPIIHSQPSDNVHLFEIQIDGNEKIILKTFKDMVSVKVEQADIKRFEGSQGMMGEFGTGIMFGRDGETVFEDPVAFAAEWQVRQDEPMIFQSVHGPQHPEACQLPDPTKKAGRRLGGSKVSLEAAEIACASWDEDMKDACIHDVIATGDLELAAAGAF